MQLTLTVDTAHGYDECARQVTEFGKRLGATAAGPQTLAATGGAGGSPAPKAGATAAEPPKGKGGRPTKAEQEAKAAKAAQAAAAPPPADDGLGDVGGGDDGLGDLGGGEAAEPEVTYDQLLNAFKARAAKDGRQVTTAIMQRFGAKSIQEIPQASWGLALKAVEG